MYAIVEIKGQQYKVSENRYLYVPFLGPDIEESIIFGNVILINKNGDTTIGNPYIPRVSIEAKVFQNVKSDKIIVFKKKRRKGYHKKAGHRQNYTKVFIQTINQ